MTISTKQLLFHSDFFKRLLITCNSSNETALVITSDYDDDGDDDNLPGQGQAGRSWESYMVTFSTLVTLCVEKDEF